MTIILIILFAMSFFLLGVLWETKETLKVLGLWKKSLHAWTEDLDKLLEIIKKLEIEKEIEKTHR